MWWILPQDLLSVIDANLVITRKISFTKASAVGCGSTFDVHFHVVTY